MVTNAMVHGGKNHGVVNGCPVNAILKDLWIKKKLFEK